MKLDAKICVVALVCFTLGCLFGLAVMERAPKREVSTPLVTPRPILAVTQFPAWPKHVVLIPASQEKLTSRTVIVRSPAEEIEMMQRRSLHLIDRER